MFSFSKLKKVEAVKFLVGEIKIPFNLKLTSLEEIMMIYFRKEEALRFLSKIFYLSQAKTKGSNSMLI